MAKRIVQILFLIAFTLSAAGCASLGHKLKAWLGGKPDTDYAEASTGGGDHAAPSYNSMPNMMAGKERKYKRVTKDNFSDEQMLEDNSGSLWRKEGQGSYLFSQNNLRQIGDILNVEIEGKAADNLTAKLAIIKANLTRIEVPPPQRALASRGVPRPDTTASNDQNKTGDQNKPVDANQQAQAAEQQKEDAREKVKEALARFDDVPCRIVDKNSDGSYRVKGQSSIYVGRHEYRLIVTGIVRPDDINSEVVASTRVLEGKYDLVATVKERKE
jgi:flagellar L-ring protein FlgH